MKPIETKQETIGSINIVYNTYNGYSEIIQKTTFYNTELATHVYNGTIEQLNAIQQKRLDDKQGKE